MDDEYEKKGENYQFRRARDPEDYFYEKYEEDSRVDLSNFYGKEETDLNAMIRRMISHELTKQQKLANFTMKRAHSDTWSSKLKVKNDPRPSNIIASLEPYKKNNSSLNKNSIEPIDESKSKFKGSSTTFDDAELIIIPELPGDERRIFESVETQAESSEFLDLDRETKIKKSSSSSKTKFIGRPTVINFSNQSRERHENEKIAKINDDLQSDTVGLTKKAVSTARAAREKRTKTVSTQTESAYIVRAVRSCPSRRKPVRLHLHLDCEPSETSSRTKINQELRDLATIYRKSSDNLIYEKGKATRSPAYIPIRERFRWKFVSSKIVTNDR